MLKKNTSAFKNDVRVMLLTHSRGYSRPDIKEKRREAQC